jgi:hypothetical protein
MGARVVAEPSPGVCNARQRGTQVSSGEIVVSADADTTYAPGWLARIDRSFRADDRVVAVVGPCRYKDGPLWGRAYARLLFGAVHLVYLATGRAYYATATNIAFRRDCWPGYDVTMTQGGDELDLLRKLRRRGRVVYDHANPTYTSGRRLTRGLAYNLFVTLIVYYLLAYFLNRLFRRRVLGSAPAYRDNTRRPARYLRTAAAASAAAVVLLTPAPRDYLVRTSHAVVNYVTVRLDGDTPR